jgi:hypothetical protein
VETVTVRIVTGDPDTMEDVITLLSAHPRIAMLGMGDPQEPDVLLVMTTRMTDATLSSLELASVSAGQPPRIVLVVADIGTRQLARAVNAGLTFLLDRLTADHDQIAQAILAAGAPMSLACCGFR